MSTDREPRYHRTDGGRRHRRAAASALPGLTRDVVSFGMVEHVDVSDGCVTVRLGVHTRDAGALAHARAEHRIGAATARRDGGDRAGRPAASRPPRCRCDPAPPIPGPTRCASSSVRHVIAVGAGKGGVGKSTVAVNLALALARDGLRVGLLDADIYGPSLPILLGIEDGASRVRMSPEKTILPLDAHGLPMISFGFFLGEGSPAIWRGPKVSKAVKQFARGVAWPELDVLVVDLPPGTGDIPVSLAQAVVVSGAVVVTQPPRVAAAEARKAVEMFRTLEVPVLGVVENMSGPFGRGAGRAVARELDVPFLGESAVRRTRSWTTAMPASPRWWRDRTERARSAFDGIARAVADALGWRHVDAVAREA